MRVLSLFDGISCGRAALERAGIAAEDYSAFEIDKYAIAVSRRNYPGIRHFGNVFEGDFKQFKNYDAVYVLVYCQKRTGNRGRRRGLAIVYGIRPRAS